MFRTETPQWALLLTLGLVALLLVPMAMVAQSNESNFNDTFYVNYYDTGATSTTTLPAIDANMYVVNPGSYTDPLTGNPGDLCAMIYVFNTTQELEECCGCHVTANGLLTFRVSQLTNNPLNRRFSTRGAIKLVSAAENCVPPAVGFPAPAPATRTTDALCDPSGGGLRSSNTFSTGCGPVVPTPELRAWIIHYNSGNFQEAEFEIRRCPVIRSPARHRERVLTFSRVILCSTTNSLRCRQSAQAFCREAEREYAAARQAHSEG